MPVGRWINKNAKSKRISISQGEAGGNCPPSSYYQDCFPLIMIVVHYIGATFILSLDTFMCLCKYNLHDTQSSSFISATILLNHVPLFCKKILFEPHLIDIDWFHIGPTRIILLVGRRPAPKVRKFLDLWVPTLTSFTLLINLGLSIFKFVVF